MPPLWNRKSEVSQAHCLYAWLTSLFPMLLADQGSKQGDCRKKNHENNGNVENQLFNSTAGLKSCAGAGRTEGAAQTSAAHLEKNKENNGDAQDNLNDANRRKPLLQNSSSLSMQDHSITISKQPGTPLARC